ncbi:polyadenylate-binding protein-interacting protein 11-like isoform X3 [Hibiscus syriacus]|uniref:polyadenylate-binding protein-interacting protein 11-like isoform X3 n=1 Tax=Hibiscus syriacus TaxID=106335 RepID=UPI001923F9C7|nr:polyadenylate-binding protein-interacting protein 11-like isoform X3 [Hibiscus syriacus]
MAVVENSSNQDAAATTVASNDQDQSNTRLNQNDQGLYNTIGSFHHRSGAGDEVGYSFKREMRELQELFSKLNHMAEEFVPHSVVNHGLNGGCFTDNSFLQNNNYISRNGQANENGAARRKKIFNQGKRRLNNRTSMAQRDELIRRTVYVSDIDHQSFACRDVGH